MDIIHLLPDSVANQIAAGEVVQRPASVVKELLENSVDAGATDIKVVLRESGKELIQVIDNGQGMSPTDARMAFERHATSKISKANDLFSLHTMGFRGEALPSIVAVSEVDLRSKRDCDETGIHLRMAASQLQSQESIMCTKGTNIEVRNLFYNVPARRKFLKSDQTELSNIIAEVQRVALANSHVGFTVSHNDTLLFQCPPGNLKQRILQLFPKSMSQQLLPVGVENELVNVEGFICQPEGAKKKGFLQYFFVNNRYMRHPYFHKAVMECYQNLIPEGSQPSYFIYLTVDPASIDVNIHPTKTEIKFENEAARWHILMATVREALGKFNAVPTIDFDQNDAPEIAPFDPMKPLPQEPKVKFDAGYNPFGKSQSVQNWQTLYEDFSHSNDRPESLSSKITGVESLPSRLSTVLDDVPDCPAPEHPDGLQLHPSQEAPKRTFRKYLQIAGKYIAASSKQGLMLIDQHRAHMTVLYDMYYQQICQHQGVSQQELFPEIIEIPQADIPILESILPTLKSLGFELDNLGGGSYAVNGKPASVDKSLNLHELIFQMIESAREDHSVREQLDKRLALQLSKTQALPYGQVLSEEEMLQLTDSLFSIPDHTYSPDGHLIAVMLPVDELSARF